MVLHAKWKAMPHLQLQITFSQLVPLDEIKAQLLHHIVAKLLFLCKRSQHDNSTAVTFLTTRMKGPDEDDYEKLTRIIKYLRSTQQLTLNLKTSSIQEIK